MSIIKKLLTAVRGGATEAGQSIVDSQAIRILDQEIRDAEAALANSKTQLTEVMAKRQLSAKKAGDLKEKVNTLESSATAALNKGEEQLAHDVAVKLLEVQAELDAETKIVEQFDTSIASLRGSIRESENRIRNFKQQVSVVKATESVQKAQSAVAAHHSGQTSAMNTAMESLERIREKQALRSEQMAAAEQLNQEETGADLDARLKAAGIGSGGQTANEVLARLREAAAPSNSPADAGGNADAGTVASDAGSSN
ncbi:PspA/IM30 family protein [Billgrantia sp. Q4P2]|uniref:PspA/IM30 family protein n=1 Tax=Billgrantia sp. Q4P2 TaxID=3463857 RepID=UPI004057B85C